MLSKTGLKTILFISILSLSTSCLRLKPLIYLQTDDNKEHTSNVTLLQYRIHAGDNLKLEFTSTDPATSALLNKETGLAQSSQINNASMYVSSYSVDSLGNIDIPLIGTVKAKGLTAEQLGQSINKLLSNILKLKSISVKMANYRISVLGEVKNPGTFFILNDQTTLLQALALAGDLTDFGNRKRVKIVRNDLEDKTSHISYVDLTSPDIMYNPTYYLHPNDVVYVEPIRVKVVRTNLPLLQVAVTSITAILLVLNIVLNSRYYN
jgi:polysaccharide export outer membrane protein